MRTYENKHAEHAQLMFCQTVPDYAAVPGWFVAPEDCEEIETDLEIGGKKIQRMMVTQADVLLNHAEPEKGAIRI